MQTYKWILKGECDWENENRRQFLLKQAYFPVLKTLEDFKFLFQPTLDKRQVYDLASCRFIHKAENIAFFGPPGVGKTHLAISLGVEAINKGLSVRFITLQRLQELVDKTKGDIDELRRLLSLLLRPKLLILDEIDLYEPNENMGIFFSQLLGNRHEKGSIIFTANQTFPAWIKLFGTQIRAEAIIDRVSGNSTIVEINGPSFRIKDKIKLLS